MGRMEKINSLLIQELACLVSREIAFEDAMITISYVECSGDLKQAKVGVSILPENKSGTALRELNKKNNSFYKELKKKLRLKKIPKFIWTIDTREKRAADIEKLISEVNSRE